MAMDYLNGDTFKVPRLPVQQFHIKYENLEVLTELTL